MNVTVEALKPLVWSLPCKAGEHDVETTIWTEDANGVPQKRPAFYRSGKAYVAVTRTASPDDVANDAARRNEETELAKREGRDPMFVSSIFSQDGLAMVHIAGTGPFQIPEEQAKDWSERGLVRILDAAGEMAHAIVAPKRKSLGVPRT